jgi:hypothetical protein
MQYFVSVSIPGDFEFQKWSAFLESSLGDRVSIPGDLSFNEMARGHCAHLWLGTWNHMPLISIIYAYLR